MFHFGCDFCKITRLLWIGSCSVWSKRFLYIWRAGGFAGILEVG